MKKVLQQTLVIALWLTVSWMFVALSACVGLRSSSISSRSGAGQGVSAEAGDYGILHLTSPDNLTQTASSQLASKCQGKLTNVQTQLAMREWVIIQWYTVDATAVCQ